MVTQHCERTKGSRILRFTWLSQPQKTKLNAIKEIHDCGKKIFFPTGQNGPEVSSYEISLVLQTNHLKMEMPIEVRQRVQFHEIAGYQTRSIFHFKAFRYYFNKNTLLSKQNVI